MSITQIGIEGWKGVDNKAPEYKRHITKFNKTFKWDRVVKFCSSLRDGVSCEISTKFSIGCFKIVKRVEFEDGVEWVAAITMPPRDEDEDVEEQYATSAEKQLESLVATYKYLAKYTTLPVPQVFAADSNSTNDLGAPYIIMTYLPGNTVDSFPYKDGRYGTEEQNDYLFKQMAEMFVELAQCSFKEIGSIFQDPDTQEFYAGSDLETGKAFRTAQEYYQALGIHRFQYYSKKYLHNNLAVPLDKGLALPLVFNSLMSTFANPEDEGGQFRLTNRDFGPHNILVDQNFTVRGIIDCDSIKACPIGVVAQYPSLFGMECRPPGYKTTWPPRLRTYEIGEARASAFRQYVREAEKRLCTPGRNETPLADAMESDGARFVEGIELYSSWRVRPHEDWIRAYWYMYYRRIRGPKAALEYDDGPPPPEDSDSDSNSECRSEGDDESQSDKDCKASEGSNSEDVDAKGSQTIVQGKGGNESCNVSPLMQPVDEPAQEEAEAKTLTEITEGSIPSLESHDLGSDGWIIKDTLSEDYLQQIQKCDKSTNWHAVASLCSSLRSGVECKVTQKLTNGTRKLVKLVEFEDGVKWVACIAMEPKADYLTEHPPQYAELAMKTEMAAFNYLREKTSIPVPQVFAAHHTANNDIGGPYMIMSYLHGSCPQDFEYVDGHPGTELQYKHLLQQMAKITADLAQCKFNRIGALFQDEESKEYYIGVDPEVGAGPFDTTVEYYNAVSKARFNYYTAHIENNLATEQNKGFDLPLIFNSLMPILTGYEAATGPFSLVNMDFGFHNILINKDFDIVGVVDCDSVMSAPIESVAQYPSCGETERVPPGMITHRSSVMKTWDCYASARRHFRSMLAEAERSYPQNGRSPTPLADIIDSDGAFLVAGLTEYTLQNDKSRQEWLKSYWYMYYRHVKGESHALKFLEIVPEVATSDDDASDDESDDDPNDDDNHSTDDGDADAEVEGDGQEFNTIDMALRGISPPSFPSPGPSPTPRHRSDDDPRTPATVEIDSVGESREWANQDVMKANQICEFQRFRSRTEVFNDLRSFSNNFKLPTPAVRPKSPGENDSVEIITRDTQNTKRLQPRSEMTDNQGEEGNNDNLKDKAEMDIEPFEGLKLNTGPEEAVQKDGVRTEENALQIATLKFEDLTFGGGQDHGHAEEINQNITKQDTQEGEIMVSNTTAGEVVP